MMQTDKYTNSKRNNICSLWAIVAISLVLKSDSLNANFQFFPSHTPFFHRTKQYSSLKEPFRVSTHKTRFLPIYEKNDVESITTTSEYTFKLDSDVGSKVADKQQSKNEANSTKTTFHNNQESHFKKSKNWLQKFLPNQKLLSEIYNTDFANSNSSNGEFIIEHLHLPSLIQNETVQNTTTKESSLSSPKISFTNNSAFISRKTSMLDRNKGFPTYKLNQTETTQKFENGFSSVKKLKEKTAASTSLPSSMDPKAVITAGDLEKILRSNNFVRVTDLKDMSVTSSQTLSTSGHKKADETDNTSIKQAGNIAFPQLSILTTKELTAASFITTGFLGLMLGTSLSPSLWLISFFLGSLYGHKIATADNGNPTNIPFSNIILAISTQIAKWSLLVWDATQGIWFMYKTGQLSYQYYKTYASFDSKFKIQKKVDAWNARFIQGKQNFDAWERENEVGRKILAGLRTAWFVEENRLKKLSKSFKKGKRSTGSRYRILNYIEDCTLFCSNFARAFWCTLTRAPGHENDLSDLINGVRLSLSQVNFEVVSQRFGSGIAALVGINFLGALFTISPTLLGFLAVGAGMMFPNWVAATYIKIQDFGKKYSALGRGEKGIINTSSGNKRMSKINKENKYSFFMQENGKKKWYRTGNSMFKKKYK